MLSSSSILIRADNASPCKAAEPGTDNVIYRHIYIYNRREILKNEYNDFDDNYNEINNRVQINLQLLVQVTMMMMMMISSKIPECTLDSSHSIDHS